MRTAPTWTGLFELTVPDNPAIADGGQTQVVVPTGTGDGSLTPITDPELLLAGWVGRVKQAETVVTGEPFVLEADGYPRGYQPECTRTCQTVLAPAISVLQSRSARRHAYKSVISNSFRLVVVRLCLHSRARFDDGSVVADVCLPETAAVE